MTRERETDEDFPLQKSTAGCHEVIFRLLTKTNNIIKPLYKIILDHFQRNFKI